MPPLCFWSDFLLPKPINIFRCQDRYYQQTGAIKLFKLINTFLFWLMVVLIPRREIDIRPIIGAAVVLIIIGSIIFGIFYFFAVKPAAEELESSKLSAMSKINELSSVGTSQASSSASNYSTRIQAASSTAEVESILVEVNTSIQLEHKRKELLDKATTVMTGSYYSATGAGDTKQEEALATPLLNLKTEINARTTLSDLFDYETLGSIDDRATTTWRDFLSDLIYGIQNEILVMKRDTPTTWYFKTKTDALAYVAESTWQTLRELDFEDTNYVEVPVVDTVNKAPTIKAGSQVNVYFYDTAAENLRLIVESAAVNNVLYSKDDIAMIAWSLSFDNTTNSYYTDIWETLKAAAAGSEDAALVMWENYGSNVMDHALKANIIDFTVNAIYVVKVPTQAGERIIQYEFYQSATKDVTLTAQTT